MRKLEELKAWIAASGAGGKTRMTAAEIAAHIEAYSYEGRLKRSILETGVSASIIAASVGWLQ